MDRHRWTDTRGSPAIMLQCLAKGLSVLEEPLLDLLVLYGWPDHITHLLVVVIQPLDLHTNTHTTAYHMHSLHGPASKW